MWVTVLLQIGIAWGVCVGGCVWRVGGSGAPRR